MQIKKMRHPKTELRITKLWSYLVQMLLVLNTILCERVLVNQQMDHLRDDRILSRTSRNVKGSSDIVAQFLISNGHFTHQTFATEDNSFIFAGASNRIFKLNANLSVIQEAITGPKADNPECHGRCPESVETLETVNHNKILIVNSAGNTLIACGSIQQGSCDIYNLKTFPKNPTYIELPLAANDEKATTYAFIGPSRYTNWRREDVLYVGTTFTNVGDYRHDVPAISSRRLDNLNYAEFSIQQSILNIDVKYRDHFIVEYVYGFNTSEYAYFVVVQKKSHLIEEAGYVTRLARICINDPNYDSYTEITIQCKQKLGDKNADFNILRDAKIITAGQHLAHKLGIKRDDLIMVAAFSPSKEITNEPQSKSAICIYSLKDIEEVFTENIHMCFNGTLKDRNLGYISGNINDGKCPIVGSIGNVYNFCSVGLKISGVAPVESQAAFVYDNESITSVTATNAGPHTLAFLGTSSGNIKKVVLSGAYPGEYEQTEIDRGNAILPDTMISSNKDFLFVLSTKKLTKLRVEHCADYTNCSRCLESRDPFCGWCSLEKRCTIRNECQKDTSASRWLSLDAGQQCIDFEMVSPDRIAVNHMSNVELFIRTLPELPPNAKYKCVFGNSTPIDAVVTQTGLSCLTPPINNRPLIDAQKDHILVPLSVRSSETQKDFVSKSFAFFDCSRHDNCRQCVQSKWNCNWCIYDNKCVYNTTSCRNTGTVINTVSSCPHYKKNNKREVILLPNKVPKEIKLEIENLPRPQSAHTGFLCIVNIEGAHMSLPARVESKKYIVCEKTPYSYEAHTNEYEAHVDIYWNRNHYIDTVPIHLYKCDVLGSHREHADCSLCITRAPIYQCTWCSNSCVYNESCAHGLAVNECPRPRIDMIKPLSGPIEGGTLITIEGSNLGIREEDVRGKIRIGDVPCELVNYEISVKIECRTGPVNYEMLAPVRVGNEAGYTESSVHFQYKDIKLYGLFPTVGPISGGTKMSIMGNWLNTGSSISVFLDSYECLVNMTHTSSARLTCITSASRQPDHVQHLNVQIDGANRSFSCLDRDMNNSTFANDIYKGDSSIKNLPFNRGTHNQLTRSSASNDKQLCSIFNYTHDPKILQIKPLKSFASGGRMLTVHGMNLDAIQKPELEVYFNEEKVNKSICTVINKNRMECPSPAINSKYREYKGRIELMQQLQSITTSSTPMEMAYKSNYSKERHIRQTDRMYLSDAAYSLHTTPSIQPSPPPWPSSSIFLNNVFGDDGGDGTSTTGVGIPPPSAATTIITNSGDLSATLRMNEPQIILQISFLMDNVQTVKDLNKHFPSLRSSITYVDDPVFFPFLNNIKFYKGDTLVIEGENLNMACDETDVVVTIGQEYCNVTSLALTQLVCTPPEQQPNPSDENGLETSEELPLVVVRVGKTLRFVIGYLKYDLLKPYTFSQAIVGISIGCLFIVVLLCIVLVIYRRKSTQAEREYKRIQIQMDTLESNVRLECKQAFAELQTDMTDLTADLESSGIPTLDHMNYIMKVFFPGVTDHPILRQPKSRLHIPRTNYDAAMLQFEKLLGNKHFLLTFIETLEAQKSFNIRDKVNVASLLIIILMSKMDYATDVLRSLLQRLIEKAVLTKHPQLMLRRTESVVEKMLTNYMAICMYDYLRKYAGSSLFLLFKAIKHQIEKGVVDACTHEARYSLSEEKLLREQIDHHPIILHIIQDDLDEKLQCKVLDCDTISQVKSKILDALFKNTPFSMRPSVHEVDLEWRHGRGGQLILQDEDLTSKIIGNQYKRLNTLSHYGVKESAIMSLVARQSPPETYTNYNKQNRMQVGSSKIGSHNFYNNNSHSNIITEFENCVSQAGLNMGNYQYFHLTKPIILKSTHDDHSLNIKNMALSIGVLSGNSNCTLSNFSMGSSGGAHAASGGCKAIPEIFLTRLLATKGTIQKFVDDFFATILTVNEDLPPAVKWLFDFLDDEAARFSITELEIVHAWKSNSLPLRFWVNFIKNPDFIFDINKTPTVDACLSVIAQTFMDACATTEHRLGKDSPSNKLLFAKDIPQYRAMVQDFYTKVAKLPHISDSALCEYMQNLSVHEEFDVIAALKELYIYVTKYRDQIVDALNQDANCVKNNIPQSLAEVACILEGEDGADC